MEVGGIRTIVKTRVIAERQQVVRVDWEDDFDLAGKTAGDFCRRHLPNLLGALGVSLLAGAGMVGEYILMASFLGIHLPFWKTVAGWAAGWLSFLMPLPGGLGRCTFASLR